MKIAIISPYLVNYGGASRFSWDLANYFAKKGDKISYISLYADRKKYDSIDDIKIIDIMNEQYLTQSIKFWLNLKQIRKKLHKIILKEKPDIVFFNNFPSTLWAQKFDNIPIICYPHDIELLYGNTYIQNLNKINYWLWKTCRIFLRKYEKSLWENFDLIISNSKFTSKNIFKKYGCKSLVLHPGTNIQKFISDENKERAIITFASQKSQNPEILLQAVSNLNDNNSNFKIWIIGNNSQYRKKLTEYAHKLHIGSKIKFFGKVTDDELIKLYSKSMVCVHLVYNPPFGIIVLESMSCNTPVIAIKPGGVEEIIEHNVDGFLIKKNDLTNLNNYLIKILNNPEFGLKLGLQARNKIEFMFDQEKQFEKIRNIMLEQINHKRK